MKTPVFTGVSTALITPFNKGFVDYDAYAKLLNIQKIAGIPAVTVCGTTGEAATMTPQEQYDLIKFSVSQKENLRIIAGCGTNDTFRALDLAFAAEEAGADALLIVTPYYNKPTQNGLIKHYSLIAENTTCPIILYNVPSRTGVSISVDTCRILSQHKNINGIKEVSGDFLKVSEIIRTCGDSLNVWSGNDDDCVSMMRLGAQGVISVAANIVPDVMQRIASLWAESRFLEAENFHSQFSELFKALFYVTNPIPTKTILASTGICSEEMRLPLTSMEPEEKKYVLSTFKKCQEKYVELNTYTE